MFSNIRKRVGASLLTLAVLGGTGVALAESASAAPPKATKMGYACNLGHSEKISWNKTRRYELYAYGPTQCRYNEYVTTLGVPGSVWIRAHLINKYGGSGMSINFEKER